MKIKKSDFSFEESLNYLDNLAVQMPVGSGLPVYRGMNEAELPSDKVVTAFCVAMMIKVIKRYTQPAAHLDYVFFGAVSQILNLLHSSIMVKHIDLQYDGSILVLLDAPMKKDVEEIITLSAQIRSINEVVLKKFNMSLNEQVVALGLDYGAVSYFMTGKSCIDPVCYGSPLRRAKLLADEREDSVNISNDIYVNLSDEQKSKLFVNRVETSQGLLYYHAPLINIRMHKWVVEH